MKSRLLMGSLFAFAAVAVAPAVMLAPVAAQAQTQDAGQFIQELGNKAIAQLAGKGVPEDEERARFKALLNQYFDVNAIGKFTAGRAAWSSATPQQQQEFLSLYEGQVINAYAKRFENYSGEQIKITGEQKEQGDDDTIVNSQITNPRGGPPVTVQWRVRSENGGLKVADVVIDGISMAVTDRQQFAAVIQRGGGTMQALIDALKNQQLTPASAK